MMAGMAATSSIISHAKQQVNKGIPHLLLKENTKIPHPSFKAWPNFTQEQFLSAVTTASKYKGAYQSNLGLVMGKRYIAVDWDRLHDKQYTNASGKVCQPESPDDYMDGVVYRGKLMTENEPYETVSWTSRNGGMVDLFLADERMVFIGNGTQKIKMDGKIVKLDIKVSKQYMVIPPSKVPADNSVGTGKYEWIVSLNDREPSLMPEWLFEIIRASYGTEESPKKPQELDEPLEIYQKVLEWAAEKLPIEYSTSYDTWIKFAYCCARCINGGGDKDIYYNLFHKFSSRSPNYDDDSCEKLLDSFLHKPAYTSLGTIRKWADKEGLRPELEASVQPEVKEELEVFGDLHLLVIEDGRVVTEAFCREWFAKLCVMVSDPKGYWVKRPENEWVEINPFLFARAYEKDVMNINGKLISVADAAKKYATRRVGINLSPNYDPTRHFNPNGAYGYTYTQGVARADPDISLIDKHVWEVLCCEDEKTYEFVTSWMGAVFLNVRTNYMLLMYGTPGSGKSIIMNDFMLGQIVGNGYGFLARALADIAGKFNIHLDGKTYIVCDDLPTYEHANASVLSAMKILATSSTNTREGKGSNLGMMQNTINVCLITNHAYPVEIEVNDRRYVCIETSPRYVGQTAYFDDLARDIQDPVRASKYASYCIDAYRRKKPAPIVTNWKVNIVTESSPVLSFLRDRCPEMREVCETVALATLYGEYESYLGPRGRAQSKTSFYAEVRKFFDARNNIGPKYLKGVNLSRDTFDERLAQIMKSALPTL